MIESNNRLVVFPVGKRDFHSSFPRRTVSGPSCSGISLVVNEVSTVALRSNSKVMAEFSDRLGKFRDKGMQRMELSSDKIKLFLIKKFL